MDYQGYPPNGTYEDILGFLARAEEGRQRRQGIPLPRKSRMGRRFLEPVFNVVGLGMTAAARLVPAPAMLRFHDWAMGNIAKDIALPFEEAAQGLREARRLAEKIERETGRRPALLCLMSHAPVDAEWLNLNVEMTRHVVLGLASVRKEPCRPRMLIAIDSYGLDMLPLVQEAMYAGFMGVYHLGIDRLALRRNGLSGSLIRSTAWRRMPWRLLQILSQGREVGIVLAGGVPQTARALYAVREFLAALRSHRDRQRSPKKVLEMLREQADFKQFSDSGLIGQNLQRSAWRIMEAWMVARIVGEWDFRSGEGKPDAYEGKISSAARSALQACGRALGCPSSVFESGLKSFEEEFRRETPYRARLFRLIAARVVRRGRPVLLMPLTHRFQEGRAEKTERVRLSWGHPVVLPSFDGDWTRAADFAEKFARSNFP